MLKCSNRDDLYLAEVTEWKWHSYFLYSSLLCLASFYLNASLGLKHTLSGKLRAYSWTRSDAVDTVRKGTRLQVLGLPVPALQRIPYLLLLGWALNLQKRKKKSIIVCKEAHKCLHMNIQDKTAKIEGACTYVAFCKYLAWRANRSFTKFR